MPGTPVYDRPENLHSAIARGDQTAFREMLSAYDDADAIPDFPHATLLHFAVAQGRPWAVEAALKKGADPNRLTPTGKTALDLAEEHDWRPLPEIVSLLKQAGGKKYAELPETVARRNLAVLNERAKTANRKLKF